MPSRPVDLPFLREKIIFATIFGVILWKMKVLLQVGTLMSDVLVENVLASVDPIVAKNLLKVFAMLLWSLISFLSSMTKDVVLFPLVVGNKSLSVFHSF